MFSPICSFSTDSINVLSGAVFLYPMKKRNISLHCSRIECYNILYRRERAYEPVLFFREECNKFVDLLF